MKENRRNRIIAIGAVIIVGLGFVFYFYSVQLDFTPHVSYSIPYGTITMSAALPDSPDNLTLYKVIPQENDMAYYSTSDLVKTRSNVTSESDASMVSQKLLEKYGGLPHDGVVSYVKTEYLYTYNFATRQDTPTDPVSTNIQYSRVINGHSIVGNGGFINIELGNDGELLYLNKIWRTVTPSGTVPIITPYQAIKKMQRGEILGNNPKCGKDLTITKITPTYYEKGRNVSQKYLDPVWVFAGTLDCGDSWYYSVSSWRYANFTESPASGPNPLTIQFNDTSDASPSRWLWEFGDGMNSTVRNPVHSYASAGMYNVTLTGWNDLGSDTVTKPIRVIT
jgi:PKD repeat protein